jgi:hypothetical protein
VTLHRHFSNQRRCSPKFCRSYQQVLAAYMGLQDVSQEAKSSQNHASKHAALIHEHHLILTDYRVSFKVAKHKSG